MAPQTLDVLVGVMMVVVFVLVVFIVVWRQLLTVMPVGVQPETRKQKQQPHPQTDAQTDADMIDEEMNGATIKMGVGDVKTVMLRGNATTGYAWRVVKAEGRSVVPDGDWKYKVSFPFMIGSGGFFLRRFEAVAPGQTDVYMTYDPISEPQVGYSFFIRFVVG